METRKTAGDVFWHTIIIMKEISNSMFNRLYAKVTKPINIQNLCYTLTGENCIILS